LGQAVFSRILWPLGQFHMRPNINQAVSRPSITREVTADMRSIFSVAEGKRGETAWFRTVEKYEQPTSRLADWLEGKMPEGLTVFALAG